MTEEELLALNALVRKEAEGMGAREKALQGEDGCLQQQVTPLMAAPEVNMPGTAKRHRGAINH